jgi:hypothetical protein
LENLPALGGSGFEMCKPNKVALQAADSRALLGGVGGDHHMVLNVEDGMLFLWLLIANNYLQSARAISLATP